MNKNSIFDLDFNIKSAKCILLPIPWEVTVSYRSGTVSAPSAIKKISNQIDLSLPPYPSEWKKGIAIIEEDPKIINLNNTLRPLATKIIEQDDLKIKQHDSILNEYLLKINAGSNTLNDWVNNHTTHYLNQKKVIGLIGGDHSTPLGLYRSLNDAHKSFGILQLDAHQDLRKNYQGFNHSHASIMHNALKLNNLETLTQVGIRDFCEEEILFSKNTKEIITFTDFDIKKSLFRGVTWDKICQKIISSLPQNVHLSLDIDVLNPSLCPNTGTPVPGGLSFDQVQYLIYQLVESKKNITSFDLVEVSPKNNELNAIIAMRLLYFLCCCLLKSNEHKKTAQ